jgi:hypothetical protein
LRTAAVAALASGVLGGIAFGAQAWLLRAPAHGELVAAHIDGMLSRYRYLRSTIHVAGEPRRHAECLQGWQVPHGRRGTRGAQVLFSDGEQLLMTHGRVRRLRAGTLPEPLPPVAEVQLAGCARSLTAQVYAHLVGPHRVTAVPRDFMGHAALSLHLRTRRDRIDLFVARRTLLPIGLRVETHRAIAWSTVDPIRLTPPLERSFLRRFDAGLPRWRLLGLALVLATDPVTD